jgi:hypothetical protein
MDQVFYSISKLLLIHIDVFEYVLIQLDEQSILMEVV